MSDIEFKINENGVKQINDLFKKLLVDVSKDIKEEAKDKCPVKSGKLKESIDVIMGDNESTIGTIGSDYGLFIEVGTRNQQPQPFLRPALDNVFNNLDKYGE